MCSLFCDFSCAKKFHNVLGSLRHGRLYPGMVTQLLHPKVQRADDGLVLWTMKNLALLQVFFFFLWVLWLRSFRTKYIFTNHVVVLKAQLVGLACLEDLHSDELDLHLAVLKHLLRRCQQLAILRAKTDRSSPLGRTCSRQRQNAIQILRA